MLSTLKTIHASLPLCMCCAVSSWQYYKGCWLWYNWNTSVWMWSLFKKVLLIQSYWLFVIVHTQCLRQTQYRIGTRNVMIYSTEIWVLWGGPITNTCCFTTTHAFWLHVSVSFDCTSSTFNCIPRSKPNQIKNHWQCFVILFLAFWEQCVETVDMKERINWNIIWVLSNSKYVSGSVGGRISIWLLM